MGNDSGGVKFEVDLQVLRAISPVRDTSIEDLRNCNASVPIEISRIKEGGYSLFVGGFINDGLITWYAFDIERRLFVAVLGRSGQKLNDVPELTNLSSQQFVRFTNGAGCSRSEFVTLSDATPEHVREFSNLANELLSIPITEPPLPAFMLRTDVLEQEFVLIHKGKHLPRGGGGARMKIENLSEKFIVNNLAGEIRRVGKRCD